MAVGGDGVLGELAGEEAAVELDGAAVGDEIDLNAAVDDADVAGAVAGEGVLAGLEAVGVLFDGGDEAGHLGDGVDAEVGLGAVGGPAMDGDAAAEDAFGGDDGAKLGGLGDDGGIGAEVLAEADDAAIGVFFIHDGGEQDLAWRGDAGFFEGGEGVHHGGEAGLGIAGAAAIHAAIADDGVEGRDGHALDGNGVRMGFEDEAAVRIETGEAGDDVGAAGEDLLLPDLDAALLEKLADVGGDGALAGAAVIGGIDAVDADEICQGLDDGGHKLNGRQHGRAGRV